MWQLDHKEVQFSSVQFSSVQLLSRVWLFATPWITAHQASMSITNSRSSLRFQVIWHRLMTALTWSCGIYSCNDQEEMIKKFSDGTWNIQFAFLLCIMPQRTVLLTTKLQSSSDRLYLNPMLVTILFTYFLPLFKRVDYDLKANTMHPQYSQQSGRKC